MEAFDVLNRTFDRIFVISLRRARERHGLLRERLRGLDYEIFVRGNLVGFPTEPKFFDQDSVHGGATTYTGKEGAAES